MRHRGGYDVPLAGRPVGTIQVLGEVQELALPLRTRRLAFTDVQVDTGQRISQGQILARDPDQYGLPLLAPRSGVAQLDSEASVLRITEASADVDPQSEEFTPPEHAAKCLGPAAKLRNKLVDLGAWQFFCDAFTGEVPDPFGTPQAVIVSTVAREPFSARGDVALRKRLSNFHRGLEQLQNLLEYQPIFLVVPAITSGLAEAVREAVRGYARVKVVAIPLLYPHDHFAVLARQLGLSRAGKPFATESGASWMEASPPPVGGQEAGSDAYHPVWGIHVEGVLAVDRALTLSKPSTVRIVAVGGPGASKPGHLKACAGYPIQAMLDQCGVGEGVRVLAGGTLTGSIVPPEQAGLDAECTALTVLPDEAPRQFLGFARPGGDRQSFGRCFLSALKKPFVEKLTTALRGERRACVACGMCQEVCPVDLWPHLIHKYLYKNDLEGAQAAGVDVCVDCGLCSYVCVSKIELADQFRAARDALAEERRAVEAERRAEEERERKAAEARAKEEAQAAAEPPGDPPGDPPPSETDGQEVTS